LKYFNRQPQSISKKIKDKVKTAAKFANDFEETAANIAIENGYDYVICGHIHKPQVKTMSNKHGSVIYLNSGDWVENLTSLEYYDGEWHLFSYNEAQIALRKADRSVSYHLSFEKTG